MLCAQCSSPPDAPEFPLQTKAGAPATLLRRRRGLGSVRAPESCASASCRGEGRWSSPRTLSAARHRPRHAPVPERARSRAAGHTPAPSVIRVAAQRINRPAPSGAGRAQAEAHLRRRGLRILARGARTPRGEIDLVALDPATGAVVFVDVRTSTQAQPGWLRPPSRARLRRLALEWLAEPGTRRAAGPPRFDAICVVLDDAGAMIRLDHVQGPGRRAGRRQSASCW